MSAEQNSYECKLCNNTCCSCKVSCKCGCWDICKGCIYKLLCCLTKNEKIKSSDSESEHVTDDLTVGDVDRSMGDFKAVSKEHLSHDNTNTKNN